MKSQEVLIQELFDILRSFPRIAGGLISVEKAQMPAPDMIVDMRAYIDSSVQGALTQQGYQYIPTQSDCDNIVLLDLTHGYKEYDSCIDEIASSYNFNTKSIDEMIVATVLQH